ncbi:MAG: hypothetical protein LBJ96_05975 [Holosporaceae bacterium]|jgi:hypothetical protein|nr:hypothetical protein [Holosporaceae bacterium]
MINVFSKVLVGMGVVLAVPMCQGMRSNPVELPSIFTVMQMAGMDKVSIYQETQHIATSFFPPPCQVSRSAPREQRVRKGLGYEAAAVRDQLREPGMESYQDYNREKEGSPWQPAFQLVLGCFGKFNTALINDARCRAAGYLVDL